MKQKYFITFTWNKKLIKYVFEAMSLSEALLIANKFGAQVLVKLSHNEKE